MSENGVKSMSDFAAEIGAHRNTIGDVVAFHELPTEPMSNGKAKGLGPKTQRIIRKILNIKATHAST